MKNKNKFMMLYKLSFLLMLPFVCSGCLYENPELTTEGELGVDPTAVTLNVTLNMNLNMEGSKTAYRENTTEDAEYMHRFIVEAYLNRQPVARETFVEEISDRTHIKLPVNMKLHAREYQLVVWTDYVKKDTPDEDLFYRTDDLMPVIPVEAVHQGNTPYKDVQTASVAIDLSKYRNQFNALESVNIDLKRPMARYELVANDVKKFITKATEMGIENQRFKVRIKYSDYIPEGYNALDGVPKHSLAYMQYVDDFRIPAEEIREMTLGFDYIFIAPKEETTYIPVEIEIVDEANVTLAQSYIRIPCSRNHNSTIKGAFLTGTKNGDGIGFEPDFDGEVDLDVDIRPL